MDLSREVALLKEAWDRFFETVSRPPACLRCGGDGVWWDGTRVRTASVRGGGITVHLTGIRCRRVRCAQPACGLRWCLFPPGLGPRRHFQACVVSAALQDYLYSPDASQEKTAARHGCVRRTLGRWLRWVAGLAEPAVIEERTLAAQGEPVLAPLRAVADLARKACTEAQRALLQRAALVLALLEGLAGAHALAPPALGSVLEHFAPLGARLGTQAKPLLPEFARSPQGGLSGSLTV